LDTRRNVKTERLNAVNDTTLPHLCGEIHSAMWILVFKKQLKIYEQIVHLELRHNHRPVKAPPTPPQQPPSTPPRRKRGTRPAFRNTSAAQHPDKNRTTVTR
jgi:hypothetical protein